MKHVDAIAEDLLADLTEPQRAAVTHTDGPLLVLAGPGSGKTRVITRRAAYLARTVTAPWNVLAITFTNKAAGEMRERIEALGVEQGMTIGTFHAVCAKLLRIHHERAGVTRNFTIFDRDDRRKVLKRAIEAAELSTQNWTPARVEKHISDAKNAMMTPADYAEDVTGFQGKTIARIYEAYEGLMTQLGGLDFDDLLMRFARLLECDRELRDQLEDRFRYVLVDEYQDTNEAQYRIARLLSIKRQNICATGDPDQSIYGWRGANIDNILSFERDYPEASVVRLEQNYRSTGRILSAADGLIANNLQRKAKTLWTDNHEGAPVRVVECEDANEEARTIAEDIEKTVADCNVGLGDVAVFYRINAMSRPIEEAFLRGGIKYQIARGLEFYSRKEIKDVLAYLRVLVNPADDVSLRRIINTPTRGIGQTTIDRLFDHAGSTGKRVFDVVVGEDDLSFLGRSAGKAVVFRKLLRGLSGVVELGPREAIERVVSESGLRAMLRMSGDDENEPLANVDELISAAAEFQEVSPEATLVDWLEHAALVSDVDSVEDQQESVTLMTLHAAKGLEFPVVYIVGLEDGVLPFCRDFEEDDDGDIEEERRLCFVGMTRARSRLTLTHVLYRMRRGSSLRMVRSEFLDELPEDEIEWRRKGGTPGRKKSRHGQANLPPDIEQWEVGTVVRHPLRGLGQIMSFEKMSGQTKVKVKFEDGHSQTMFLGFAPLRRVDFDEID